MATTTSIPSVQIGEIMVPGTGSLHGAKTFMLTRRASGRQGPEFAFGLLSGDTQKRTIERLADRLVEELRGVIFDDGDDEARFEGALKRANSVILAFLHEHGLSLPGIKLRGAFGLFTGDRLFIASRGSIRGVVAMPQTTVPTLSAFTLFEESSDTFAHPKFFSSFQNGSLPPGARLYIASAELFQATDEAFAIARFTDADGSRGIRDLKQALRMSRLPVSMLTLAVQRPEYGDEMAFVEEQPRPQKKVQDVPKTKADVGDLVSRGLRISVFGVAGGLRKLPGIVATGAKGFSSVAKVVGHFCRRGASAIGNLFRGANGRITLSNILSLPRQAMDAAVRGINRVPRHRVAHFIALFVAVNLIGHGVIFSVRRQLLVGEVKAYESRLAEVQQTETDLESSMIYGDTDRMQSLSARLESIVAALPQDTDAQKQAAAEARAAIGVAQARIRKEVSLPTLSPFVGDAGFVASAWHEGFLYVFGADGAVRRIGPDGTTTAALSITGLEGRVVQATGADNSMLLTTEHGTLYGWNVTGSAAVKYDGVTFDVTGPILSYQNRVYDQEEGGLLRRAMLAGKLGASVVSVPAAALSTEATGLAADGTLYVLSADGTIRKFLKGAPASGFDGLRPNPAPTAAADLVLAGDRLAYLDRADDHIIIMDAKSGGLIAQASSPGLSGLKSLTWNADGTQLYVLDKDGKVYAIPFSQLKP